MGYPHGFYVYPLVITLPLCQYIDMVCVYCSGDTRVTNSRLQKKANSTWRRRQCIECGAVVTTLEKLETGTAVLVVYKTHQEPFSRDKLLVSLHDSLKHRKTALADASALTDTLISNLYPLIQDAVLEKSAIVAEANKLLQRFDRAAATHYVAFHPI